MTLCPCGSKQNYAECCEPAHTNTAPSKTAEALIKEYGTLDNIYANIENIEKKRWQTLLTDGKEMAFISKQLVTLSHDCHCIDNLE